MKKIILASLLAISITNEYAQSLTSNTIQDSNEVKRVFFYGTTTLNTTDDLIKSITGSQKFNAKFAIKPIDDEALTSWGFDGCVNVNALNLKPTGVDKDSIDLTTLMFPETGNFGFSATPILFYQYRKDDNNRYRYSAEFTAALRQSKVSNILVKDSAGNVVGSENVDFSILNFNVMPVKLSYLYTTDNDKFKAEISLGFYYNFFNIPNEDAKSFNKLFPEDKPMFKDGKNSAIHSVGGKFVVSLNGFMFFADLRNNFTDSNLADNNPFKGFVFNAGFATNIEIFSK